MFHQHAFVILLWTILMSPLNQVEATTEKRGVLRKRDGPFYRTASDFGIAARPIYKTLTEFAKKTKHLLKK